MSDDGVIQRETEVSVTYYKQNEDGTYAPVTLPAPRDFSRLSSYIENLHSIHNDLLPGFVEVKPVVMTEELNSILLDLDMQYDDWTLASQECERIPHAKEIRKEPWFFALNQRYGLGAFNRTKSRLHLAHSI
jgi:hypothetical protein